MSPGGAARRNQPGGGASPQARAVAAVLRRRLRWLLKRLDPLQAAATRLLPVLLHASFGTPLLRSEPPGVEALSFRRAWAAWARLFGLPPAHGRQRERTRVEAVLALPRAEGGLDLLAFLVPGLRSSDRMLVLQRLEAAREALSPARGLRLRLVEEAGLGAEEREACFLFGALVAGRLPANLAAPRASQLEGLSPEAAVRAPTSLSALALLLAQGIPGPSAEEGLRGLLDDGAAAEELADPSVLCVRLAAPRSVRGRLLEAALAWTRPDARELPEAFEIMEVGRALAIACFLSVHRVPRARARELREVLRREALGAGLPRLFLRLLARHPMSFEPAAQRGGSAHSVQLVGGAIAGHGRSLVQARVRALALRAAARRPSNESGNVLHDLLEARLARRAAAPTLFVVIEHVNVPGPPFDMLNRGPERGLALRAATLLLLRPNRRPTAWRLPADQAVRRVVEAALAGREVEVVPLSPEGQPAAARLTRVANFVRQPHRHPVAVEAGGVVLLGGPHGVRSFPLARFAARPVACDVDPEAVDLALSPERGIRPQADFAQPGVLDCRIYPFDPTRGCVLTRDDEGHLLREVVPLDLLEAHLADAAALLRLCATPATLATRLAEPLDPTALASRVVRHRLPVALGGEPPFDLWLDLGGERIDLRRPGVWSAIAEQLLAGVPMGAEVRPSVERADVTVRGEPAAPILHLYARSLVLRRLGAHLRRLHQIHVPDAGQGLIEP